MAIMANVATRATTPLVARNYTFGNVLANSKRVAWQEDEVLNGRRFDLAKRFLPNRLSGVDEIDCLNEAEKRQLNQVMGNAYCHLFAFVEEFIVPTVTEEVLQTPYGDEVRQRALVRFAEVYAHLQPHEQQELFQVHLARAEVSEHRLVLQIKRGVDPTSGSSPASGGSRFPPPIWLPERGENPNSSQFNCNCGLD